MSTISAFKASMFGGGSRSNQFRVDLTFPSFVSGSSLAGQLSQFMVFSSSLPEAVIAKVDVDFRGRKVPLAGEREFRAWTVKVYNDTNFAIRNAFMSWQNTINNLSNNGGVTAPTAYTSDMIVTQLDRNGAELYQVKIVDAWPSTVGELSLSFSESKVQEFDVTFEYLYWQDNAAVGGA